MTLATMLLTSGVFLTLLALFAGRAARVSMGPMPKGISEERRDEIQRYRSDLSRYAPLVLRLGLSMIVAGAVVLVVVLASG